MRTKIPNTPMWTIPEFCRVFRISCDTGYTLAARDEFPCRLVRIGKRILVPRIEVERLLGLAPSVEAEETTL